MINDLVVKVPTKSMLEIKKTKQLHGSCGVISNARKAAAHEDKLAYTQIVLSELDDKPTMQVHDLTDPEKKAMLTVEKAKNMDYKAALAEGYRIVDAAVLNWMHIADNKGNSAAQSGNYSAYDEAHYGMFRDAHMWLDLDAEHLPKQNLLRATMKMEGAIKSLLIDTMKRKYSDEQLKTFDIENSAYHALAKKQVVAELTKSVEASGLKVDESQIKTAAENLLNQQEVYGKQLKALSEKAAKLGSKPEAKEVQKEIEALKDIMIHPKQGPIATKAKMAKQIDAQLPGLSAESVNQIIDNVVKNYKFIENINNEGKALRAPFKLSGQAEYIKKLFTIAAYNRVRTEFKVEIPEYLEKMAETLNVEPKKELVLEALENKGVILTRDTLDKIDQAFKDVDAYKRLELKKGQKGYKSDNELYKPIYEFKKVLKPVAQSVTEIKREIKRDFIKLNKDLDSQLDELAKIFDVKDGHFWVKETLASGVQTPQQVSVASKVLNKDHIVEMDYNKVLDHMAEGGSVPNTGSNVSHEGLFWSRSICF